MNRFYNFSANVQNAFDGEETKYLGFSQLLKDTANGVFEQGITKADANKMIKEKFRLILGVDEKASAKEIRRAIIRNKQDVFELIEDTVEDMLVSGWENVDFFNDFVEVKNLALGDANEFITADKTVLTVGELAGDHWDIDRQKLDHGKVYHVPTSWIGLKVYEEFELVMTGRRNWDQLVQAVYEAIATYVNKMVYAAVMSAGSQVLPGTQQFYKSAALDDNAKPTFLTMVQDVQAANGGAEVVIMGTKAALGRLSAITDVAWLSQEDKSDRRNLGRLGMWEGVRLVEIPQVFEKNNTGAKLIDPNVLMIMPLADNKFVKLVYEGNSQIRDITDNKTLNDWTYEFAYLTKIGVGVVVNRYFGQWNIIG